MNLTEIFTVCERCAFAPSLCGNEPENCVAYIQSAVDLSTPRDETEKALEARKNGN